MRKRSYTYVLHKIESILLEGKQNRMIQSTSDQISMVFSLIYKRFRTSRNVFLFRHA